YTMLFAAFGGEEQGLIGSKYFVAHYPNLDKVALLLQIDMVGSEDKLITFLETDRHQAPQWLVRDVFTSARQLGLNNLQYPTHFFSINNALPGGGAGSDHQPFLDKNIPAIDFTVGVNNSPIHTPQDKFDNINKPMMQRCGLLVDGLLTKYQEQKIPTPRTGEYMLWQLFGRPFFMPSWLVLSTVVIALLLGTWAFIHSRKKRLKIAKSQRVRFSGLKLLTLMLIMAIFTQLGEAIMQFTKGLRYPWMLHIDKYLWFAAIWSVAGIWVSLQITRKWRFSPDPYVYTKRTLVLLFTFIILLGMTSVRLTLYPAITLTFISLSIFIPIPFIKFILSLIAPLPMFKLMFMETFPFLAHNASLSGFIIDTFWRALFYSIALTILLVIWYLPVIYLYTYSLINFNPFKNILKRFRSPAFGLIILLAILGYGMYLNSLPSYNELWRAAIHVDADYDVRSGESKLQLIGNEYFRNVRVTTDSLHKQFDERKHKAALSHSFQANWINISGDESAIRGEKDTVNINWLLTSNHDWYRTSLKIQVDTLEISDVHSDLIFNHQKDRITFNWYADPPDTLPVATSFTMYPGAKLTREVSAIFPEMPMPINVTAELADVRYR
ncbi:MAG: M28 family metallopeptidase, partial [bacterium]